MPTFPTDLASLWTGIKDLEFDAFFKDMGDKALAMKVMPADQAGFKSTMAPQWVRYGPAVLGGHLSNRTDLAQACSCTHRKEPHDRLDLREVIHRLPDDDTVHVSWVSVVSH